MIDLLFPKTEATVVDPHYMKQIERLRQPEVDSAVVSDPMPMLLVADSGSFVGLGKRVVALDSSNDGPEVRAIRRELEIRAFERWQEQA